MIKVLFFIVLLVVTSSYACMKQACEYIAKESIARFGGDFDNRYQLCRNGWDDSNPLIVQCKADIESYKNSMATMARKNALLAKQSIREYEEQQKRDSINNYNKLHKDDYILKCSSSYKNRKGVKVVDCSDRFGEKFKYYSLVYDASTDTYKSTAPIFNTEGFEVATYFTNKDKLVCSGISKASGNEVIHINACKKHVKY